MSSWKKYGGINNSGNPNEMRLHGLVTNYFTVLKAITNDLDISGNVVVSNRLDIYGDASFNNNLSVNGNVTIADKLDVSSNLFVGADTYINGNINITDNLYFNTTSPTGIYLHGQSHGISINKKTNNAILDVYGDISYGINIQSSQINNTNILCRNVSGQGIILTVDASNTMIGFFHDTVIQPNSANIAPDSYFNYTKTGTLQFKSKNNMQMINDVIITDNSNNTKNIGKLTLYNNNNNSIYLPDTYNSLNHFKSDSIVSISTDKSSTSFASFVNSNLTGGAIGGGHYPSDISKNMITIGTIDFSNNIYKPNQTIVSGSSNMKYKNTLGINKAVPIIDNYALDINGSLHIENVDITTALQTDFEINAMHFYRDASSSIAKYGVVVGSPNTINATYDFSMRMFYTNDSGNTWKALLIPLDISTYGNNQAKFELTTAFVHDPSYAIFFGTTSQGYFLNMKTNKMYDCSFNSTLLFGSNNNIDIVSSKVVDISGNIQNNNALSKLFLLCKISNSVSNDVSYNLYNCNAVFGNNNFNYTDVIIFDSSNNGNYNYNNSLYVSGSVIDVWSNLDGTGGYLYIAGNHPSTNIPNIRKYSFNGNNNSITEIVDCSHNGGLGCTYNSISLYDANHIIAVGNSLITYSNNGGRNWYDISVNTSELTIQNTYLNSVFVYDLSNAIAVGKNGAMTYTTNGYSTWKNVPVSFKNLNGSGFPLNNAMLKNVFMLSKNEYIISDIVDNYNNNTSGVSKLIYNYVPDLFNNENNYIIDICGNMRIGGNIIMEQVYGNITCSGNTFYLTDTTKNIFIGTKSTNIVVGNTQGYGSFVSNCDISVNGNIVCHDVTAFHYNLTNLGAETCKLLGGNATFTLDVNGNTAMGGGLDVSNINVNLLNVYGHSQFDGSFCITKQFLITSDSSFQLGYTTIYSGGTYTTIPKYSIYDGAIAIPNGDINIGHGNAYLGGYMVINGGINPVENALSIQNGNIFINDNNTRNHVSISANKLIYNDDPQRTIYYDSSKNLNIATNILALNTPNYCPAYINYSNDILPLSWSLDPIFITDTSVIYIPSNYTNNPSNLFIGSAIQLCKDISYKGILCDLSFTSSNLYYNLNPCYITWVIYDKYGNFVLSLPPTPITGYVYNQSFSVPNNDLYYMFAFICERNGGDITFNFSYKSVNANISLNSISTRFLCVKNINYNSSLFVNCPTALFTNGIYNFNYTNSFPYMMWTGVF